MLTALPPRSVPALVPEVAALTPPASLQSPGPAPSKHFAPSLCRRDPAQLLASGNKIKPGFNWDENYRRAGNHRATPSVRDHQQPPSPPQAGVQCKDSLVSDVIRGAPLVCGHACTPQPRRSPRQDRGARHGHPGSAWPEVLGDTAQLLGRALRPSLMQGPHPGTQELTHGTAPPAPQDARQDTPHFPSAWTNPFKEVNGILFTAGIRSFLRLIQEVISNGIQHHPGMRLSCRYANPEAKSKHSSEVDAAAEAGCSATREETLVQGQSPLPGAPFPPHRTTAQAERQVWVCLCAEQLLNAAELENHIPVG